MLKLWCKSKDDTCARSKCGRGVDLQYISTCIATLDLRLFVLYLDLRSGLSRNDPDVYVVQHPDLYSSDLRLAFDAMPTGGTFKLSVYVLGLQRFLSPS
jgi:hypothetical protein